MSQEIQFEYTNVPPMVTISDWGARRLGLKEIIMDPYHDREFLSVAGAENLYGLSNALHSSTPEQPVVQYDCQVTVNGSLRWHRVICRATWSSEEPPRYLGAIGKVLDIHEEHTQLIDLKHMASHDALTGLLNHANAKKQIKEILAETPEGQFALVIFDLDFFKTANDQYGHIFGDHVLKYMAKLLRQSIRSEDIAARVGGDEFLIFLRFQSDLPSIIHRIFHSLMGEYEGFPISISMGVARTDEAGREYQTLFHCADQALYAGKRQGRGRYCFYDSSMRGMLSVISSIESGAFDAEEKTEPKN